MLAGYFDESYNDERGVYAVAGFLFTVQGAKRLSRGWAKALTAAGLDPKTQRFHMADFAGGYDIFKGWSEKQRRDLINSLIRVISRTQLYQVSAAIDRRAFDALSVEDRDVLGMPTAYVCCVWHCFGIAAAWLETSPYPDAVAYFLDRARPGVGKGKIMDAFNELSGRLDRQHYRFGTVTWADSQTYLPLQAADFFAYEIAREAAILLGREERPVRESFRRLSTKIRADRTTNWLMGEASLRDFVKRRRGGNDLRGLLGVH